MSKKILVIGAAQGGKDPVSSIMTSLAAYAPNTAEVYFFSFRRKAEQTNGPSDVSVPDLHTITSPLTWWFQGKKRLYNVLKWDNCLWASSYAYYKLSRLTTQFDVVIGVGGLFYYIEAAYWLSVRRKIPLKLVYFDPFTQNIATRDLPLRKRLEQKWLAYADVLYYNLENTPPEIRSEKTKGFYIPIFPRVLPDWQRNNTFLYGGNFYRQIRTPDGLYDFARSIQSTGWRIECYSNLQKPQPLKPIKFGPLLPHNDFKHKCAQAGALIYIGNTGGEARSSKYLEYISYRKPVIGIQVAPDDPVRRYKYYLDATDLNLIKKLDAISADELKNYNPWVDFPEREPQAWAAHLFS